MATHKKEHLDRALKAFATVGENLDLLHKEPASTGESLG
jgi:hypothetical protein